MDNNYTESTWNGFKRYDFKFENRDAIIVFPEKIDIQRRWLLKTEYFGAFPDFELEMLKNGWHLAYVSNSTRWHKPEDDDVKAHFCEYLHSEFNLNQKCVPVGMSCGGMHAVYFAAKYPHLVFALYLDAPVLNLLSCPCGLGVAGNDTLPEFEKDTGMNISLLLNYRNHPIDHVSKLLCNNIPVMLICGDSDTVVPYCENGKYLTELYRKGGGTIKEIIKPGCNHHPHGLTDCTPIVEFVLKHSGE